MVILAGISTLVSIFFAAGFLLCVLIRVRSVRRFIFALWNEIRAIGITLALMCCFIYLYITFLFFRANGEIYIGDELVCNTLLKCVAYGINVTWRSPGGIGDIMLQQNWNDGHTMMFMLFTISFFIMMLILVGTFMSVMFMCIREKHLWEERTRELSTVCIVCGATRTHFGSKTSLDKHLNETHDPWNYMQLYLYLRAKIRTDKKHMSSTEIYVAHTMGIWQHHPEDRACLRGTDCSRFMLDMSDKDPETQHHSQDNHATTNDGRLIWRELTDTMIDQVDWIKRHQLTHLNSIKSGTNMVSVSG